MRQQEPIFQKGNQAQWIEVRGTALKHSFVFYIPQELHGVRGRAIAERSRCGLMFPTGAMRGGLGGERRACDKIGWSEAGTKY